MIRDPWLCVVCGAHVVPNATEEPAREVWREHTDEEGYLARCSEVQIVRQAQPITLRELWL